MEIREGLTFDDVLLIPQHSRVMSRSAVNLTVQIGRLKFDHPIIPANMSSVTGWRMAAKVVESKGLAILHRFMPQEEQFKIAKDIVNKVEHNHNHFAISLGVKYNDLENFEKFYEVGVRIFCVDVAHGDSEHCVNMVKALKETHPGTTVIAGNVATGGGARLLWEAGADVVKVGVGPGSLCTTRIETGNGVPQLTALMNVQEMQQFLMNRDRATRYPTERRQYPFIADGGIKSAGDLVKALCFADMVMVGNLFAGCEDSPGERRYINGIPHKEYRGSSTHKANHIEGVSAWVPCAGSYEEVSIKLLEGLRSGCSYQGANSLSELKDNPTFIKITHAGLRESHPHDVITK